MLTFNHNLLSFTKSKPFNHISKESKANTDSLYSHPHLIHDLFYCILVLSILHFYFIFSFGSSIFIASCLFILARSLPEISQKALEESEARLLSTIKSKYVHKWSTFNAGGHDFKVHSIHVIDRYFDSSFDSFFPLNLYLIIYLFFIDMSIFLYFLFLEMILRGKTLSSFMGIQQDLLIGNVLLIHWQQNIMFIFLMYLVGEDHLGQILKELQKNYFNFKLNQLHIG